MSDDDKSMDVHLICNQRLVTYNKYQGVNLMGLSSPWDNSLEITCLYTVKRCNG